MNSLSFCSISDMHIKGPEDPYYPFLLDFMDTIECKEAKYIIFLGDIFDLMVGSYLQNLIIYESFFDKLADLIKSGKVIHYVEGNHDFHLENLFLKFSDKYKLPKSKMIYSRYYFKLQDSKKMFYIAHGDWEDETNTSYIQYKRFITSRFVYFLTRYIVTFSIVQLLGNYFSKKSRENNTKKYTDSGEQEKVKNKVLAMVEKIVVRDSYDYIILGHSHIEENITIKGSIYANNGFFKKTQKFISYKDGNISLVKIKSAYQE